MNHKGTQRLDTNRLTMKRFEKSDCVDMLNNWISIAEVQNNYGEDVKTTESEVYELLNKWTSNYSKRDFYRWAIIEKNTKKNIGQIAFYKVNARHNRVEVEYCIGNKYWGQGYATEAVRAIIDFAFKELEIKRVEAFHRSKNPSSGRVLEKSGMIKEGTMRNYIYHDDGYDDCHMYSIIKEDWEALFNGSFPHNRKN